MRSVMTVALLVVLVPLSGCTGLGDLAGCGEGYEEMHSGDYVESLISIDINGTLTVEFESGDNPGFLEESEAYQTNPDIYVTLYVLFDDQTETSIAFRQSGWDNYGDGAGGSSWGSTLTFNSPSGFCSDGCARVKLGTSMEYGLLYYDGTCNASPWLNID